MNNKERYVQDILPKVIINDECIKVVGEKARICILNVEPIGFKLKSENEQCTILELYKIFLKKCNFDFQILIQSEKEDISKHIEKIERCINYENKIKDITKSYMELLKEIFEVRGNISKKFYIILKLKEEDEFKIDKVIEGLSACGNSARVCNKKEITKILRNCFQINVAES